VEEKEDDVELSARISAVALRGSVYLGSTKGEASWMGVNLDEAAELLFLKAAAITHGYNPFNRTLPLVNVSVPWFTPVVPV